ncbi:YlmC/YmxH family sporulation protein [Aureibacillus halotolerans]|uniref:YlmC/YmxH family sporulation protein n=1 Tax=Aureibacillus halotolerans TaxID=1508390 RepID=A0A4R6U240_9BACI|nr:YlmC/YmxH family sporulation protein [Aureibacillus halotolerans]TDQ39696.1 YlmC/YmxH family sporulation protein [Aureibacillus halotolerans]
MRLSELNSKEIIDLNNGERHGTVGQCDLEIDVRSGNIHRIIVPDLKWLGLKKASDRLTIEWSDIETIGKDMVLINSRVELSDVD